MIEIKHKLHGSILHVVPGDQLAGADLESASLVAADLSGRDLSQINLEDANLSVANLKGADLSKANLTESNLTGAALDECNLIGANLQNANLCGASLRAARLNGANLSRANLEGADLSTAQLQNADLQKANLTHCGLLQAQLAGARYDVRTRFPANFRNPDEHGAVLVRGEGSEGEASHERYLPIGSVPDMNGPLYRYVEVREEEGVIILTILPSQVEGEEVAEALRQELIASVTLSHLQKVALDFRNVKYLSSVAFRPLLSLRRKLKEIGGKMVLCGLSKVIGDVFYTTRLVSQGGEVAAPFELQPDVDAAVRKLNEAAPAKP